LLLALTLSTFVAGGPGCTWHRLDPLNPKARQVVATFPCPPAGAKAAWSANRKRALVWFDPTNRGYVGEREEPVPAGLKERLFLVDLVAHTPYALPLPPLGALRDVGFDAGGAVLALTEQEFALGDNQTSITFEGKPYAANPAYEGMPVLVHAYRLEPNQTWKRVETAMSATGADYAPGVNVLTAAKSLGARSSQWLDSRREHAEVKDARVMARLAKLQAAKGDAWVRIPGAYVWTVTGEFLHTTGRIAFDDGKQATLAPGLPWGPKDPVALTGVGNYLLGTCAGSGSHPRLWDLRSHRLVFHQDQAWDTVVWPD
jgi:hypothetical protein